MKQTDDISRARINARKVGPLVVIAVMAGQRKITRAIAATMLLGNDVFNVEAIERFVVLM